MTKRDPQTVVKTAIYLRISQDSTGEHLGVTRQNEDCTELAKKAGWEVAQTYTDNDVSATSGKVRPGYKRMLEAIAAGNIEGIICWSPDRLYRRLADLETLIPVIEAHGVQVRTVKAGDLDLGSAYGRMIARILGAVATGEGELKSERWKRSWRQRREAGDFAKNGRRNFGYTIGGKVVPAEAEVARWMAGKILTGTGILTLAREMEALELCTSYGNVWTPAQIKRYLVNPRIAGWAASNGQIIGEGNWTPLIDRETYEGVRALLTARTRAYVPRKALLTRLITCECGMRMITSGQKGTRTYRCPNRPGMSGCGKVSGNAEPIEAVVETFAKVRLSDPQVRASIGKQRLDGDDSPYAELAAVELRIVELEKQLDDPALSLAAIMRAIDRAHERREELSKRIVVRSQVVIPAGDAAWPEDLASRRALVDLVVESVTLRPATKASRLGFDHERVEIVGR